MKWLSSMLTGIFILLFVLFAVVNRHLATIDLFPLPFLIDVPLSLIFLGGMILGLIIGSLWIWVSHSPIRREARIVPKLKHELETLKTTRSTHGEISRVDPIDNQQSRLSQANPSQSLLLSMPSGPQYHALTAPVIHTPRPDAT